MAGRLRTGRLLGTVSGLAALHASWVFWILARSAYRELALSPAARYEVMCRLLRDGAWTVNGATPKEGELLLVWIAELLVVVLSAAGTAGMYCQEREHERKTEGSRVF